MPHRLYEQVAARAEFRCEYCQAPEEVSPDRFQVEHILPRALGGSDVMVNLALSCSTCNQRKSQATHAVDPASEDPTLVPLFDPRRQLWRVHFDVAYSTMGFLILGQTPIGRATVARLAMNDPRSVRARALWAYIGLFPP
jgi:hypothetical protein